MSKKQIDLATISGIQEISDQAAESLSGAISQSALQRARKDAQNEANQLTLDSIRADREKTRQFIKQHIFSSKNDNSAYHF